MTLYNETVLTLKRNKHNISDILWCEKDYYFFSFEEFKNIAKFDYDNSSGVQVISKNLRIYGTNFFLERYEFDGTEGWSFIDLLPEKPLEHKIPNNLFN